MIKSLIDEQVLKVSNICIKLLNHPIIKPYQKKESYKEKNIFARISIKGCDCMIDDFSTLLNIKKNFSIFARIFVCGYLFLINLET